MHGITIYNVLRDFPIDLTTYNLGNVDSIGNVVFLAGKRRYASPHSTFMFHGVGLDVPGPTRLVESNLRETLGGLLADQNRIGQIVTDRTTIKPKKLREFFRHAKTVDADAALGAGIVHDVRDVQIPAGAPVLSLVFQR